MFTNRDTEGLLGSLPRVVTHGFKRQIHICPYITFSTTRVQCLWCRIYHSSKGQHMEKTDFLHFSSQFLFFLFLKEIFMNLFNWWYFVLITQRWFNSQSVSKTQYLFGNLQTAATENNEPKETTIHMICAHFQLHSFTPGLRGVIHTTHKEKSLLSYTLGLGAAPQVTCCLN